MQDTTEYMRDVGGRSTWVVSNSREENTGTILLPLTAGLLGVGSVTDQTRLTLLLQLKKPTGSGVSGIRRARETPKAGILGAKLWALS